MRNEQTENIARLIEQGAQAKALKNNTFFSQLMADRKSQIFEKFCRTAADDNAERDELWRTMQNLKAIERHINEAIHTAVMAAKQQGLD